MVGIVDIKRVNRAGVSYWFVVDYPSLTEKKIRYSSQDRWSNPRELTNERKPRNLSPWGSFPIQRDSDLIIVLSAYQVGRLLVTFIKDFILAVTSELNDVVAIRHVIGPGPHFIPLPPAPSSRRPQLGNVHDIQLLSTLARLAITSSLRLTTR